MTCARGASGRRGRWSARTPTGAGRCGGASSPCAVRCAPATRAARWSTAEAGSWRRSSPPARAGRAGATASRTRWCAPRSRTRAGRSRQARAGGELPSAVLMGKTLVIAEKPSVGRDLTRTLPGPFMKHEGYLESESHVVSWAVGHLVELAEPDEYDPKYKKWRMADLPIVPDEFKLVVRDERSRKQFTVLSKLMRRSDVDVIVNACDAGREGELIFAWTYEKANARKPVRRLWLSSMTTAAIKQAFGTLRPGAELKKLEQAARSRS